MAGTGLMIHPISDVTVVNFADASILDTAQIERIGAELYRLVEELDRRKLVLDFTKVQFLSSSALGVLISLRKKVANAKGQLVICAMRKEIVKVFEIMKLTKQFTFMPTETEALSFLGVASNG